MERSEYQEEKHTQFIYSSKRRIQRIVLSLEKEIANKIYEFNQKNIQDKWLESNLSFLCCWKFSKINFGKPTFWCDAIYFDSFQMENKRTFTFTGYAWIGLSNSVDKETKVPVFGRFIINARGKKLKKYKLKFYNENQLMILEK